ncbi:MAG TPA: ribosomal-processing cysteine protease Prp [Clostridia bacterium]
MISINIIRDKKGFIWQFTVEGHAGQAERGYDVVCAAVSAVTQTAVAALGEMLGKRSDARKKTFGRKVSPKRIDSGRRQFIGRTICTIEDGYLNCSLPVSLDRKDRYKAGIILDAMVIGLNYIKNMYEDYIFILDEEV